MLRYTLALALTCLPLVAHPASTFGNPSSHVKLVAGPATTIHSVVAHSCSGGQQTIAVGATLSKGGSSSITFAGNTFCAIDVKVRWTPLGALHTVPVGGFEDLVITGGSPSVSVDVDASSQTATLN